MTDSRPIWLLDIDGVLNAVRADTQGGYRRANSGWGRVIYRPAVTQRIGQLHAAGGVDIRWLSTWMDRAQLFAEASGLPLGLSVAGQRQRAQGDDEGWWKADAAREVAERHPDRFIIWTDDDLADSYGRGELDWVIGRRMLRLSPDPEEGLTDLAMSLIEDAVELANLRAARAATEDDPLCREGDW